MESFIVPPNLRFPFSTPCQNFKFEISNYLVALDGHRVHKMVKFSVLAGAGSEFSFRLHCTGQAKA